MAKKALLMILDGWGLGKHDRGGVFYNTPACYLIIKKKNREKKQPKD